MPSSAKPTPSCFTLLVVFFDDRVIKFFLFFISVSLVGSKNFTISNLLWWPFLLWSGARAFVLGGKNIDKIGFLNKTKNNLKGCRKITYRGKSNSLRDNYSTRFSTCQVIFLMCFDFFHRNYCILGDNVLECMYNLLLVFWYRKNALYAGVKPRVSEKAPTCWLKKVSKKIFLCGK